MKPGVSFSKFVVVAIATVGAAVSPSYAHAVSRLSKRADVTRYDADVYNSSYKFAVYHTNWATYQRNYQVSDLPIDYIPEVDYAFVKLSPNGDGTYNIKTTDSWADFDKTFGSSASGLPFQGNLGAFYALKQAGKKFNLKLALGGWTMSNNFSPALATSASRASVISSLVNFYNSYPIFNGLSLDWEYVSNDGVNYGDGSNQVSSSDSDNLIAFLKELRSALTNSGMSHYQISFCTASAPEKIKYDVPTVASLVDEFHIMSYDFASSTFGDTITTHHTNLYPSSTTRYSTDASVKAYMGMGVPASKIMIGAAFYSRGFANTDGLGKSGSGTVSVMSWETGVADYKSLPRSGFTEYWDDIAKANYAYNPSTKEFLSYDSVRSIEEKCAYVKSMGLKGIIAWESAGDAAYTKDNSLIKALYNNLLGDSTKVVAFSSEQSQAAPNVEQTTATATAVASASPSSNIESSVSVASLDAATSSTADGTLINLDQVLAATLNDTKTLEGIISRFTSKTSGSAGDTFIMFNSKVYKLTAV